MCACVIMNAGENGLGELDVGILNEEAYFSDKVNTASHDRMNTVSQLSFVTEVYFGVCVCFRERTSLGQNLLYDNPWKKALILHLSFYFSEP